MHDQQTHLPKRLRRLTHVFTNRGRPLFFVTICVAGRRQMLADENSHAAFREFCSCSPEKAGVWVGRYVLMPDHIHVFVSAEGSPSLSRWVGNLKRNMTKTWKTAGHAGPFWQEGFFDHVLRSGESYAQKWAYVFENPVRAGLVATADQWPYAGEFEVLRWD